MKGDRLVIWPANIDKDKSRREGRRVSLAEAVEKPTHKEIEEAARKLGIKCEGDAGASRPSEPRMAARGRLLIENNRPKAALLRDIAKLVREGKARGQRR